jgi:predicted RecA/RadA family phage recombinase
VSAQAWTAGALVYWDDTAKLFTTTSTSNTLAGVAVAIAANPTATGRVRLNGSFA